MHKTKICPSLISHDTHANDVAWIGRKAISVYSTISGTALLNYYKYFKWYPEVICIQLLFRMQTGSVPEVNSATSGAHAGTSTSLYFQQCVAAVLAVVPCVVAILTPHVSPREPLPVWVAAEEKQVVVKAPP